MAEEEPIAIIGTACRFPGEATSPSRLWDLLQQPRDVRSKFPSDRWDADMFFHPNPLHHGTSNVRHGYFLRSDIRNFDADFFGISAVEAIPMDPQHRMLLEAVYEGVESAGLRLDQIRGTHTGVYVGTMTADYGDLISGEVETMPTYFATGTARAMLANRVSYFFDWNGPSITVDTACSSSLVAVHEAVQLLRFDSAATMAIAAGTNIMLHPYLFIGASNLSMLSPEGRSRMWDSKASGYARGEGVGVVILKRLSDAIRHGDNIQSIIRNTGVNQDGKTPGITMPSPHAQKKLIKATYAKAGLDLSNPRHRPQYIEAHGTGTPTGDPLEAEALHTAFFQDVEGTFPPIPVGSLKTIIGHTEGAAGLAGILKANLALQYRTIPPNMHFEELNPRIEPFYSSFRILEKAIPWPKLEDGAPHRASVNCFGFGGTNAHAIMEAYRGECDTGHIVSGRSVTSRSEYHTLNISAAAESSLGEMMRLYADFLTRHPDINLNDLSWTLNSRRSTFASRISVSGRTPEELAGRLNKAASAPLSVVAGSVYEGAPRILGIFTGQGSQWPGMGADLIEAYPIVTSIIEEMQQCLDVLPDGPSWSLREELLAKGEGSHVHNAEISQPLCTAVQIILVRIMRAAGIQFDTVIGHSSGEIVAAFAAGWVGQSDAIRVAYYRGKHLSLAKGADGCKGTMMAAGLTMAEADELCNDPEFVDRIHVGAYNSGSIVTLSGDADAIHAARRRLEEKGTFARVLEVEKAYHSHHMLPVAEEYLRSLQNCLSDPHLPMESPKPTRWISTVRTQVMKPGDLDIEYWVRNMVQPVYFYQAVELATQIAPFELVVECSPHPALKRPGLEILQDSLGHTVPYTSTLMRGKDCTETLGQCFGFIWQILGAGVVDYDSLLTFLSGPAAERPRLLDDLPSYPWKHDRKLWHEPRVWARMRRDADPPHELLGLKCVDGMKQELRWKNILRPQEISWLSGHQVQGTPVFPAAGYIVAAIEASLIANRGFELNLIMVSGFRIEQGMVFDSEKASIETQFSLTDIALMDDTWSAAFAFYMASPNDPLSMTRCASGTVSAVLGEGDNDALPGSAEPDFGMISVGTEQLYRWLEGYNLNYGGVFRALHSLRRKHGVVTGDINNPAQTDPQCKLLLHPATIDNAFQSLYLANCYPGDGRFWTLHLPVGIDSITVNPQTCQKYAGREAILGFRSVSLGDRDCFDGDTDIYDEEGKALAQFEGIHIKPMAPPTAADDTALFYKTVWHVSEPNHTLAQHWRPDLSDYTQFYIDRERVALFHLLQLDKAIKLTERDNVQPHFKHYLACVDFIKISLEADSLLYARPEWLHDTADQVEAIVDSYLDRSKQNTDLIGVLFLGDRLPAVVRGEHSMMQLMIETNIIDGFYDRDIPFCAYSEAVAKQMDQLAHRYPGMNILEIGAGTGGTTGHVLKELGDRFAAYTYTDISASFFERARDRFRECDARMDYRTLDVTIDPTTQGFKENTYDCIICSLILHATPDMDDTLQNVRRLLKPGGYLVMLELVERPEQVSLHSTVMVGALLGWFSGYDSGRKVSPAMSKEQWEACLSRSGFAGGIDAYIPRTEEVGVSYAVITSQATNEQVDYLRAPVGAPGNEAAVGEALTIIGGDRPSTAIGDITFDIVRAMEPLYDHVHHVGMSDLLSPDFSMPFMGTVLFLADLDTPIFQELSPTTLEGMKQFFQITKTCLWVTLGALDSNPYHSMSIGLCRTIRDEMPHMRLQCLDFGTEEDLKPKIIVKTLLQLDAFDAWTDSGLLLSNNVLWAFEQEIHYRDGAMHIPRVVQDVARNERYNSNRRRITTVKHGADTVVGIKKSRKGYEAYEALSQAHDTSLVTIRVHCTTLHAVQIARGLYAYLILGAREENNTPAFAVAFERQSVVRAPASWVVPCGYTDDQAPLLLSIIQTYLAAASELLHHSNTKEGTSLVLLEPEELFLTIVSELARGFDVKAVALTSQRELASDDRVYVHQSAPKRTLESYLPSNTGCMIIGSAEDRFSAKVVASLPTSCEVRGCEDLISIRASQNVKEDMTGHMATLLQSATGFAISQLRGNTTSPPTLSATELIAQQDHEVYNNSVLTWDDLSPVPLLVKPIDSQSLFDASKTYWLVGLTGGLGNSLSEWMVKNSARHLVLTSRNPSLDPAWLNHMKQLGASVTVFQCDTTNYDDVLATYLRILDLGRPIGGVTHGAMVLKDAPFANVDIESARKVIDPKVKGAINLDRLFSCPSTCADLDFFVAFSSITAVVGNKGQAIYSAANNFLSGIIARRQRNALVGSVINISSVLGAGLVTRDGDVALIDSLNQTGIRAMAESDLHQLFAEAVFAGKRRSLRNSNDISVDDKGDWKWEDNWEITTGPQSIRLKDVPKATWATTARFSHCLRIADNDGSTPSSAHSSVSVKALLAVVTTEDEARKTIAGKCPDTPLLSSIECLCAKAMKQGK